MTTQDKEAVEAARDSGLMFKGISVKPMSIYEWLKLHQAKEITAFVTATHAFLISEGNIFLVDERPVNGELEGDY